MICIGGPLHGQDYILKQAGSNYVALVVPHPMPTSLHLEMDPVAVANSTAIYRRQVYHGRTHNITVLTYAGLEDKEIIKLCEQHFGKNA